MSDDTIEDIPMAECGACESIIPLDSSSCSNCGAVFGEVSDTALGECGACGKLQSVDATECVSCGVSFVGIDEVESTTNVDEEMPDADEISAQSESEGDTTTEIVESSPEEDSDLDTSDDLELPDEESDSNIDEDLESNNETADVESLIDEMAEEDSEEPSDESSIDEMAEETSDDIGESSDDVEDTTDDEVGSEKIDEIETTIAADSAIEEEVSEDDAEATEDLVEDTEGLDQEETDSSEEQDTTGDEDSIDDEDQGSDENEEEESENDLDEVASEEPPAHGITDQEVITAFENLALAIASSGMTAADAFNEIDRNEDGLIDGPELQKGIERIGGEDLKPTSVKAIMNYLDSDNDNRIDPQELLGALDGLGFGIQAGKLPKVKKPKEFPTPVQKLIMGKNANDIYYPVLYFLFATFIGLWIVNGMGLLVDGTGGNIVYEGHQAEWGMSDTGDWDLCEADIDTIPEPCFGTVRIGETYPCDPTIDPNKCANSLTIFSGENGASSMPKGFYGDGVFMIILGVFGLIGTAYLHLVYSKVLRERAEALKGPKKEDDEETSDSETDDEEDSDEETEEDSDEETEEDSDEETDDEDDNALDAPKDLVIEDAKEPTEDDGDEDEEEIDIGSWVGLDIDGEEFFGEIIEFDDDEGTVTIETEDGEEIIGYQDEMFLDEE